MTLQDVEQRLRADSEFALLDYKNQQLARASAYLPILQQMAEFTGLTPQGQATALATALEVQAPILRDREMTGRVADYGRRYLQGDNAAATTMLGFMAMYKFTSMAGILRLVGPKLLYPAIDFLLGKPSEKPQPENTRADVMWSSVAPGHPEAYNIAEYFDALLSSDKQAAQTYNVMKSVMPLMGAVYESIQLTRGIAGTWQTPVGLGKLAMDAGAKISSNAATRFGEILGTMVGRGAHAAIEGLVGYAQNIAADVLSDASARNLSFREVMYNNIKYYGAFFLGDIAFNMVAGVAWPMIKNIGRTLKGGFTGKGAVEEAMKNLDQTQVRELLDAAMSGKMMDSEVWTRLNQLSPRSGEAFLNAVESFAVFKHVPHVRDAEKIFRMASFAQGFLTEVSDTGWRVRRVTDEVWQSVGDFAGAKRYIEGELGKVPHLAGELAAPYAAATRGRVQKVLTGTLGKGASQNVDVLTRLIAPVDRTFTPDKVRAFSQAFLSAKSVSNQIYKDLKAVRVGDVIEVSLKEQTLAKLPALVAEGVDEIDAISKLTKALDEVAKNAPGSNSMRLAQRLQTQYGRSLMQQKLFTPAWVDYATQKALHGTVATLPDGSLQVAFGGGATQSFRNSDDLGKYIIRRTTTPEELAGWLRHDQGLTLKIANDGTATVFRGKLQLFQETSFDALLDAHEELLPKAGSYLGPELTFVDDQVKVVRYVKNTAVGNYQELMKHLGGFYSGKPAGTRIPLQFGRGGTLTLYTPTGKHIEVFLPDLDDRFVFSSIEEAKEFLAEGAESWSTIQRSARHKGMRVIPYMGKYLVYGAGDNNYQLLDSLAGVQKAMREVPLPEWMPELSGISEDLAATANVDWLTEHGPLESFRDPVSLNPPTPDVYSPKFFKGMRKVFGERRQWIDRMETWHKTAQHLYRPPDAVLVDAVKRGADPKLLEFYRASEAVQAAIRGQDYALGKLARTAFYQNGRLLGLETRKKLKILAEAAEEAWPKMAQELKLTAGDLENARTLRRFFGETAEAGLAGYYGLDWERFVTQYMPRVRKAWVEGAGKLMEKDVGQLLSNAFEGRAPKELDAFFRHLRVSEVAGIAMEEDPLVLLEKYIRVGNRNTFLGPLWKEATDYIKANRKTIDPMELGRFELYRSQVMGVPQGYVEHLIKQAHQEIWTKLGGKYVNPKLGSDLVEMASSFTFLSALGFRPFLGVRNDLQIWTTLASRIENEWVGKAVNMLAKASGREYVEEALEALKRKGILASEVLTYSAGGLLEQDSLMKKITSRGLRFMHDSDEWSRTVAYWSARLRFDNAVEKLQKGTLGAGPQTAKLFDDLSGAFMMDDDLRRDIHQLIGQRQFKAAADTFAAKITEETMFPYRMAQSSLAFRGTIGKIFGRFGHYPLWYVENIRRGLMHGSMAQKLGFMTRFVGNSLAIYGMFQAIGIQANDFLPWTPAFFGGGPMYNLGNKMLQAMDFRKGSYQGRQARGELFSMKLDEDAPIPWPKGELFGRWLPTFVIGDILQGVKAWQEGDTYGGIMSIFGATMVPDRWLH